MARLGRPSRPSTGPLTCTMSSVEYSTEHGSFSNAPSVQKIFPANVFGVLVARSHIFKSQPSFFLMSLSGHKYQILIKANTSQSMRWIQSLDIQRTYRFSNLVRSSKMFQDPCEIVIFFTTTESSECMELEAIPPCINPWVQTNSALINYHGVVTSSISPLGLVSLDDKLNLCVFFVWSHMDLNGLYQGQEVKIYNAHLTSNKTLVMCCRSSVNMLGEYPHQHPVILPLSHIVDDFTFGFGDYRWLQKQYNSFEKKFSDSFLLSVTGLDVSTLNESCKPIELRINALAKFLGLSSSNDNNLKHQELIRDFFSVDHQCILYKQPEKSRPIIKLLNEQLQLYYSFLELHTDSPPLTHQLSYWKWSINDVKRTNLVGYLNVSKVDGYWHLSDASFTVPCIFDTQLEADLQNQVVSICQYKVIVETFLVLGKGSCKESKVYLFIPHSAITCLVKTCVIFTPELYVPPTQTIAACCTLCSTARRHIQAEATFSGCSEEWKTSDMINLNAGILSKGNHTHAVVVHYVATPTQLRGITYCFVLVSVLQSSSHHAEAGAFPCILVLEGKLLQVLPLLELGKAFYLHLPIRQDIKTFTNAKLNVQLPWSVVKLPEESLISRHVCTHSGSWWTLRDHASKGMCSVEGIVESRKELPSKFYSEFAEDIKIPGYGEPNLRTVMIVVQDEGTGHTLYLTHWNKRRYPLGLVPGARICATLVKHATSSNGNEYFQATDLTAVSVMSIPDSINTIPLGHAWSQACDITLASTEELENSVCGYVESWTILSVVITAVCGGCKMLRLNGDCEFPGCLVGEDSVTFIANARISINGMGGKNIIYLKDNNVREMLNFNLNDWDVLLNFSRKNEMKFRKCHDFTQRQFRSDAENIFQLYCMHPALTDRCIYMRCKGFSGKKNDDISNSCSASMKFDGIFCLELANKSPWLETQVE